MTLDMTCGKPSRLLLKFAFPLTLSMLQQCYSFCDTLLVGFLGAGNNPMVVMTVSVAVAVEESLK